MDLPQKYGAMFISKKCLVYSERNSFWAYLFVFPLNTMMAVPILTFEHAGYDLLLRMLGILRQLHGGYLKVTS